MTTLKGLLARIDAAEPMRRRAIQEAITDAIAETWLRRAELFDWATSRPGDHPGGQVDWESGSAIDPPPSDPGRDADLRLTALACRQKAALLKLGWLE